MNILSSANDKKKELEFKRFRSELISELYDTASKIAQVQETYNLVTDSELIEAYIYEEKALNARYRHLMKIAREHRITCGVALPQ